MTGTEDVDGLRKKLKDRFILCMQLYTYFEDIFKRNSGEHLPLGLPRMMITEDRLRERLIEMQGEVEMLQKQVLEMEKRLGIQ